MVAPPSAGDGELLSLLKRDGPLGVEQLGQALGVTATAVRQRLQRLMGEGFVKRVTERHGRGRPVHRYSLTEKAREQMGPNFKALAEALWQEVARSVPAETQALIFERVAGSLARQYLAEIEGFTPAGRVEAVKHVLEENGLAFDVQRPGPLPILTAKDCPFPRLAEVDRTICKLEAQVLSKLLDQRLELSECRLDGHACCRFETPHEVPSVGAALATVGPAVRGT